MKIIDRVNLPPGWAEATLPELIGRAGLLTDGDWVETKDQNPNGEIRLTQLADVGDGFFRDRSDRYLTVDKAQELRCTLLKAGDVLVARMPDPLARACLFPGAHQDCCTVVDVCVIRPGIDDVSTRWLAHFINAPQFRTVAASLQSGSTRKRISKKNLCTITFPLPPKREQEIIADAIDAQSSKLDAAVEGLKRVQANLKRYRASVLKAAVEGRLVPTEAALAQQEARDYEPASVLLERILTERRRRWEQAELAKLKAKGKPPQDDRWKARYQEPAAPDTTNLPTLPEGWCWTTVDLLTAGDRKCAYGVLVPGDDISDGVPMVRVGDIGDGKMNGGKLKHIARDIADKFNKTYLRGGEVLMSLVGTIGRTAVAPLSLAGANVARAVGVIPITNLVNPHWVEIWFRSPVNRDIMTSKAHEVARKTLNLEDVRVAAVALPPVQEQLRIQAAIEDLESVAASTEQIVSNSFQRCHRLRQAILKWAFEGKLVDQDPTDEPAAALLERIRAERAAAPTKTKPKTKQTTEGTKAGAHGVVGPPPARRPQAEDGRGGPRRDSPRRARPQKSTKKSTAP